MARYIVVPIPTSQSEVVADAYALIQAQFPDWVPATGNLDTVVLETWGQEASILRTLASDVPTSIFRWYGANILSIQPTDAAPATVATTWVAANNAGYTIPEGTVVGFRTSNGTLYTFQTLNEVSIAAGSTTTAAGEVLLAATAPGSESSGLGGAAQLMELVDPLSWVASVTMTGPTSGGVDAETDEAYLDKLVDSTRLLSRALILPTDFETAARQHEGVWRALAVDNYVPLNNLLSADQASMEATSGGWAGITNCNISQSNTVGAVHGVWALRLRSVAAGTMLARTNPVNSIPVTPGQTILGSAQIKAGTVSRQAAVFLEWLTAGSVSIGTVTPPLINDATGAWTLSSVAAVAPATAAYAVLWVTVMATGAANEDHYIDAAMLRMGNLDTTFALGPVPATNVERAIAVALMDAAGNALSAPVKAEIKAELDARRELNFLVDVMDPSANIVDVTAIVKALPGYDLAALESTVEADITSYLATVTWGASPDDQRGWRNVSSVRYLKLVQIAQDVPGVDYLVSLQLRLAGGVLAAQDVPLLGITPVTVPGAIAVTAT